MSDYTRYIRDLVDEYEEINTSQNWNLVYQALGRTSQAFDLKCDEARKPHNKSLNRYRDVNPYDHSRVILRGIDNDYINANIVRMARARRTYILTQGPLLHTIGHFWLMVWEQNSRAILMLNKVFEKTELKCHHYWPKGNGEEYKLVLEDVNLTVVQLSETENYHYFTRVFHLTHMITKETREVIQFHYITWPDFGVPSSPDAFLHFLFEVRHSGALQCKYGPAVIHCSAGIGRSGTFCVVDCALRIAESEEHVDLQNMLLDMRKHRMGLIQTSDQLRFSYQAIIEGVNRLNPNWVPVPGPFVMPPPARANNAPILALGPAPAQARLLALEVQGPVVLPEPIVIEELAPALPAHAAEQPIDLDDEPAPELEEAPEEEPAPGPSWALGGHLRDLEKMFSEEAPPPPPPRGESLTKAPARPLPAIPTSASLGDIKFPDRPGSSSDETISSPVVESSADDENDEPAAGPSDSASEPVEIVRRRRAKDLVVRVASMRKRARDAEKWESMKRSLYKPLSITVGFILASIVIYSYMKH